MKAIFNFSNYSDRNYVLLLVSIALCTSSFQSILIPSLDYVALNVKHSNHTFYNYALVASIAMTIPQTSSLLAGYLVNNLIYKRLVLLICGVIMVLDSIMVFYYSNFILYATFVICSGILLNALICGVDRQIVTLLSDKIREYQNDLFILLSIFSIFNFKLSYQLFAHFGLRGIIIYSLLLDIVLYVCLNAIPAIDNKFIKHEHKSGLPNITVLVRTFLKHKKLIIFWGIMLGIVFANCELTLLFTTKIYHEHLPASFWSSNMSLMAFGALFGALICKTPYVQQLNSVHVVCVTIICFGLCMALMSQTYSTSVLMFIIWILGSLSSFFNINMNTIFFKYLAKDSELVAISPVVNGAFTSSFFLVCLIGPMILNQLLQHGVSYKVLWVVCGTICILLAITLVKIRSLKHDFP